MTPPPKERRKTPRMVKEYQVFVDVAGKSAIGETFDISDKGVGILTTLDVKVGDSIELRIVPRDEIFFFSCEGRVAYVSLLHEPGEFRYRIGIEFNEGLKGFASDKLIGESEEISARTSLIVNAAASDCYSAICNFDSYPKWQKVIKAVKVLEYDAKKRPLVVEFTMDAIIKAIHFTNRYEYFDKELILSWKLVGGDIKVNDGSYVFQELRENRTNAIFTNKIGLGFYAPKKIVDYFVNIGIRNSIKALKDVSESGILKKKK